ncbi:MAG: hypothetical protein KC593_01300 [Myxococcales bacterium]|nr:hypothetical protein [Myxococcales bacterium]
MTPGGAWLAALWACVLACVAVGCSERAERAPAADVDRPARRTPSLEEVYAPTAHGERDMTYRARIAPRPDDEYITREPIPARRLVYRMRLLIHSTFGDPPPGTPPAGAELNLDMTADRLRARFLGETWPIQPGAEVRVRRGSPGTYVFDAMGGRHLGPGELSGWFVGERVGRDPFVRVRAPRVPTIGPAPMICRLIAEWANSTYSSISNRCRDGAPPWFRVGMWFGTLSADVTMDLPQSTLRADERDPPPRAEPIDGRVMLSEVLRARLWPATTPTYDPGPLPQEHGTLTIENRAPRKMIIVVDAVPVAWVEAGASLEVGQLPAGQHWVGAQYPFGHRATAPIQVQIPGSFVVER